MDNVFFKYSKYCLYLVSIYVFISYLTYAEIYYNQKQFNQGNETTFFAFRRKWEWPIISDSKYLHFHQTEGKKKETSINFITLLINYIFTFFSTYCRKSIWVIEYFSFYQELIIAEFEKIEQKIRTEHIEKSHKKIIKNIYIHLEIKNDSSNKKIFWFLQNSEEFSPILLLKRIPRRVLSEKEDYETYKQKNKVDTEQTKEGHILKNDIKDSLSLNTLKNDNASEKGNTSSIYYDSSKGEDSHKYEKSDNSDIYFEKNIVNSKYYLVKKIKNICKGKRKHKEISVIFMPENEEKKKNRERKEEKLKNMNENEKEMSQKNSKCKFCVINVKKQIFALKLKEDNSKNVVLNKEKKLLSGKDENKLLLNLRKSDDLQIYYDYEKVYYTNKEIIEWKKIRPSKKVNLQYIMFLLKNPYKMILFIKRLFLINPYKYDVEKGIDRYKYKRLHYAIKEKLGQGAFGEIWYAFSINKQAFFKNVILKKFIIRNKDEAAAQISAMREIYFGHLLKDCENITRFIEYFEEYEKYNDIYDTNNKNNRDTNTENKNNESYNNNNNKSKENENGNDNKKETKNTGEMEYLKYIWLVYVNEGYSLSQHLFEPDTKNSGMVHPSSLWWSIKKQKIGMLVLKDLMYQILKGINNAHKKNITHRDIKMENIFVSAKTPFTVRIGDWGSAVELKNPHFLFIPTEDEETKGYQPPESLFGHMINDYMRHPYYDMWGIGIVFLQFVLGTKNPLEVKNKRYQAKFENMFSKFPINALKEAIFLQSLSELCLTPWHDRSNYLVIYKKKNINKFSLRFQNNIIIKNLKLHMLSSFLNSKNETFNIVYTLVSEKYKSLISVPQSAFCSDWKCVNKYTPKVTFPPKHEKRATGDYTYKNMNDIFNEKKKKIFHNELCDDEYFQEILKERDPSGIGLPNANARDLLRQLLQFDYTKRITAEQALKHPWFLED